MLRRFRLIKKTSWSDVFEVWKANEGSDPVWQNFAKQEKGFDSWGNWRGYQTSLFGASERTWDFYEILNPNETIPTLRIGPFQAWQKHFAQKNVHTFEDLIEQHADWVLQNIGIRSRREQFPPKTQFIGLYLEEENVVVLYEGHHRAAAVALAVSQGSPILFESNPTIAMTTITGDAKKILIDFLNRSGHIRLKTSDGIELAGIFRKTEGKKAAILLHMMPATKESWTTISDQLSLMGYTSLAIDERGHGESTMNGILDYRRFTDEQQQAKRLDVEAAIVFLKSRGFEEENMVVMGASIGANLAIQAIAEHPLIPLAVALSPGLDYHGVKTDAPIAQLTASQKVILVASDDDVESFESVRALHKMNPKQTVLIEESGMGHGTHMTDQVPELTEKILEILSYL